MNLTSASRTRTRTRLQMEEGRESEGNHGVREIPLLMLTEAFSEAWSEWVEYRTEIGKQMRWPTNPRCFDKAMKKCEQWGPERAVIAIDHSIEMGFRGIWEPRKFDDRKSPEKPKRDSLGFLES